MIELCPICSEVLIPTTFDYKGLVVAAGLGCPDKHYSKVVGQKDGFSEVVDGEWFSFRPTDSKPAIQALQVLINRAVFKACRKYKAAQPKLSRL